LQPTDLSEPTFPNACTLKGQVLLPLIAACQLNIRHNRYITRIEADKARRQDGCLQEVMTDRQSERSTFSLKPGDGVLGAMMVRGLKDTSSRPAKDLGEPCTSLKRTSPVPESFMII
jgi:hypothetical protein